MRPDMKKGIKKIDTKDWKKVSVEFGRNVLEISVPPDCVELSMKDVPVLLILRQRLKRLSQTRSAAPPWKRSSGRKGKPPEEISVAIAVSDITRPVPYKGENGILIPILKRLESSGIPKAEISRSS